jgi:hypothetical protein
VIVSEVRFVPVHLYWAAWKRLKARLFPWWPRGEPGFWYATGGVIRRERPFYCLPDGAVICSPEGYVKLRAEMQRREIRENYLRPRRRRYPGLGSRDLFRANVQDRPRMQAEGRKSKRIQSLSPG